MNNVTADISLKNQFPIHYNDLLTYAFRLIKNKDDAQDLVQETYCKAYSNIDKFTIGTNARAWLYRILYNQFCNQRRKKSIVWEHSIKYSTKNCTVEQNIISEVEIIDSMNNLDEKYKIISILFFTKEFSYNEIKKVTDLKLGTVKSRIYRSRQILKDEISLIKRNRLLLKAV